jgi:rRNA-processing protein FCF1
MIDRYTTDLIKSYKQRGILIDTNILLLWFVGSVNRQRISKFNRTEKFVPEDYDLLLRLLEYFFPKIVTTPNILTEVNSLANQIGEPERSQCFAKLAESVVRLDEHYIESNVAVGVNSFTRFGLTDCGILELARGGTHPAREAVPQEIGNRYLVLTDDLKLAKHLQSSGVDAINFNHLRDYF